MHAGDQLGRPPCSGRRSIRCAAAAASAEEARKLRRERTLFFTIINAVTDPIMLTDIEGRLIVANARAEKLFAASEEERRPPPPRGRGLNNMLFRRRCRVRSGGGSQEARELLLVDPSDGSDLLFEVLSTTVEDPREGTGGLGAPDITTDLRRATEQIEENYQKLRVAEAPCAQSAIVVEPDHRPPSPTRSSSRTLPAQPCS